MSSFTKNTRSLLQTSSQRCDIFLTATVCSITFLLFLPLLPYFLNGNDTNLAKNIDRLVTHLSDAAMMTNSSLICSPQSYNGSLCLQELLDWQICLPGRQNETEVFIPSDIDQGVREEIAQVLFTDFQLPSGCQSEFKSFWCLYLFGVCDGIDQRRLPTYDHCIHIQNNTCYHIVEKALERKSLPLECSNFEVNSTNCNNNISRNLSSYKNVSCSEQFYFDKMSLTCKPECGVWTFLPSTAAVTLRVFFIVINAIGLVGCIAVFVFTCVNRKRLLVFPTVLVLYQIAVVMSNLFIKETLLLPNNSLLCNSLDLIENMSQGQSTVFCTLSGAFLLYSEYVIAILWLFQCATFFWGVIWPMHYSVTRNLGRIKYVHVTAVVISFILPITAVLVVQLNGGFGMSMIAPIICSVKEPEDMFHGRSLPLNLIGITGIILLVITGWRIADFKNQCCKTQSRNTFRRKTSQNKILLITSYVSVMILYSISTMNNVWSKRNEIVKVVSNHFMCEAHGEDMECSRDNFRQFENDIYALSVGNSLFTLIPCIYFIFLLDYSLCCKKSAVPNVIHNVKK